MTSEGKSARVSDSIVYLPCGHGKWDTRFDCVTCLQFTVEQLNQALANERIERTMADSAHERESRLSIAAAYRVAIELIAELYSERWREGHERDDLKVVIQRLKQLTPESVVHARAEHDRAVREPLEDVLRRIVARYADGDTGAFDELHSPLAWAMMSDARAALASATEARSSADEDGKERNNER